MKKKVNKIAAIVIALLLITILGYSTSYADAGSISISASNTSVNVGDTVDIVVTVNNAAGKFTLNASDNLTLEKTEDFADQQSIPIKATAKSAGTATITVTAVDITDYDKNPVTGSKSVNITVNEKQTSTGGGSTTGNNDTQTQTPSNPTNTGSTGTTTSNEPTFTETNQTVYVHNTDSVNVRSGPGTSYSSLGRLARNTAITRTGVGSNGWSRVNYNGKTAYISSSYLTTTKPEEEEKSSNAMLSALTLDVEGLSPEFNKETDNYTLQVGEEIEKIDVTATPEDEKAIVTVEGNETLQVGENKITVTVTAEDGTAKVYTIIVNKGNIKQASLGLASFNIKGIDMEGVFSPTTYEYTIEINQDVSELEITAEPSEEGATVEIIGNGDLQEGENIVNIIVKSADGEETVTYQLTIQKNVTAVSNTSDQTQNMIFIGLFVGIIVIIIIVVSILLYRKHKRKIEEEYDFNDGEEENADFYNDNFKNTVEDDAEDIDQDTITQDYTDMLEEEEIEEEKPKRKKGKHF